MRVGVIGSFVWDIIHGRDVRTTPIEEWGGITYALSAFDAALPADWQIVPIAKVGSDLVPRAREFVGSLRRVDPKAAVESMAIVVPQVRGQRPVTPCGICRQEKLCCNIPTFALRPKKRAKAVYSGAIEYERTWFR